jgi:hypothetical protein
MWLLTLQLFKNSIRKQHSEAQIEPPLFECEFQALDYQNKGQIKVECSNYVSTSIEYMIVLGKH